MAARSLGKLHIKLAALQQTKVSQFDDIDLEQEVRVIA